MFAAIRDRIVDDARQRWRRWSLRLNAVGLAILSWVQIDPTSALYAWNLMPDPVQAIVPQDFLRIIGLALFALAMLAVFVRQPKLEQQRDG